MWKRETKNTCRKAPCERISQVTIVWTITRTLFHISQIVCPSNRGVCDLSFPASKKKTCSKPCYRAALCKANIIWKNCRHLNMCKRARKEEISHIEIGNESPDENHLVLLWWPGPLLPPTKGSIKPGYSLPPGWSFSNHCHIHSSCSSPRSTQPTTVDIHHEKSPH